MSGLSAERLMNQLEAAKKRASETESNTPMDTIARGRIITYGTINHQKTPNRQVNMKIPTWVLDLIDGHMESGSNKSLIFARMIELGAKEMLITLDKGDYEIKY